MPSVAAPASAPTKTGIVPRLAPHKSASAKGNAPKKTGVRAKHSPTRNIASGGRRSRPAWARSTAVNLVRHREKNPCFSPVPAVPVVPPSWLVCIVIPPRPRGNRLRAFAKTLPRPARKMRRSGGGAARRPGTFPVSFRAEKRHCDTERCRICRFLPVFAMKNTKRQPQAAITPRLATRIGESRREGMTARRATMPWGKGTGNTESKGKGKRQK